MYLVRIWYRNELSSKQDIEVIVGLFITKKSAIKARNALWEKLKGDGDPSYFQIDKLRIML